ncbi:MAG: class I SAM-dependent methyltransferase [Actinomycetota bacterium]
MSAPPARARTANEAQREYWTGDGPLQYAEHGDRWRTMMSPFYAALFDAACLQPGERVLDIGCGFGHTAVEAAAQVAPGGTVTGVDISPQMLACARQRAAGAVGVGFLEADAQVTPFDMASYDALISGFGVVFFEHPRAAFTNLRAALRPDGRLAFVCWRGPLQSQWIAVALAAITPVLQRAPDLAEPGVPGPYAFADGDRLRDVLIASGFRTVSVGAITRPQRIADDAADAASYVLSLPEWKRLLEGLPELVRAEATAALRAAFAPYAGPDGVVTAGSAWLATATR